MAGPEPGGLPALSRNGLETSDLSEMTKILNDLKSIIHNLDAEKWQPASKKSGQLFGKKPSSARDYRAKAEEEAKRFREAFHEWSSRPHVRSRDPANVGKWDPAIRVKLSETYNLVVTGPGETDPAAFQDKLEEMVDALDALVIPNQEAIQVPEWRPSNPLSAEPRVGIDVAAAFADPPSFEDVGRGTESGEFPSEADLCNSAQQTAQPEQKYEAKFGQLDSSICKRFWPVQTLEEKTTKFEQRLGAMWENRDMARTGPKATDSSDEEEDDLDPDKEFRESSPEASGPQDDVPTRGTQPAVRRSERLQNLEQREIEAGNQDEEDDADMENPVVEQREIEAGNQDEEDDADMENPVVEQPNPEVRMTTGDSTTIEAQDEATGRFNQLEQEGHGLVPEQTEGFARADHEGSVSEPSDLSHMLLDEGGEDARIEDTVAKLPELPELEKTSGDSNASKSRQTGGTQGEKTSIETETGEGGAEKQPRQTRGDGPASRLRSRTAKSADPDKIHTPAPAPPRQAAGKGRKRKATGTTSSGRTRRQKK